MLRIQPTIQISRLLQTPPWMAANTQIQLALLHTYNCCLHNCPSLLWLTLHYTLHFFSYYACCSCRRLNLQQLVSIDTISGVRIVQILLDWWAAKGHICPHSGTYTYTDVYVLLFFCLCVFSSCMYIFGLIVPHIYVSYLSYCCCLHSYLVSHLFSFLLLIFWCFHFLIAKHDTNPFLSWWMLHQNAASLTDFIRIFAI